MNGKNSKVRRTSRQFLSNFLKIAPMSHILRRATKAIAFDTQKYKEVKIVYVRKIPFKSAPHNSVIPVSVLEHVSDEEKVIQINLLESIKSFRLCQD